MKCIICDGKTASGDVCAHCRQFCPLCCICTETNTCNRSFWDVVRHEDGAVVGFTCTAFSYSLNPEKPLTLENLKKEMEKFIFAGYGEKEDDSFDEDEIKVLQNFLYHLIEKPAKDEKEIHITANNLKQAQEILDALTNTHNNKAEKRKAEWKLNP